MQRVVDHIEAHLEDNIDLDEVIQYSHLSKFHFCRLFKAVAGLTVYEYMKGRKLSKSAEHLYRTSDSILTTAIKYGFQSHEVFTRNFNRLFQCTPAAFRQKKNDDWVLHAIDKINVDSLKLDMKSNNGKFIVNEKIEMFQRLQLIGIERAMSNEQAYSVVGAMETFVEEAKRIPNIVNGTIYRVCYDLNDSEDVPTYKELIALEVRDTANVPIGMTAKNIECAKVATYIHAGMLFTGDEQKIINTYHFLYRYRLPYVAYELTNDFLLERYDESFKGPFNVHSNMQISFSIR
ncbi:helix-turn-helix domain-containing protein [Paenibacillus amylolyticus]|nr:helix-turn-helix domain-containing protein [Paenibacillus amylolyticus]